MFTTEMRLVTSLPVILKRWTILLSWSSDLDFLCLEAGKLSTTLVTMFPAINISLTRVRTRFTFRFELFCMQNLMDIYKYIFVSIGDNYALKMRFVDHIFDDMVVDQVTVKIILPEGAK